MNHSYITMLFLVQISTLFPTTEVTSDVKCRNTLSWLGQYMCWGLRLWKSRDCEALYVVMAVIFIFIGKCINSGGETGHNEIFTF